MYEKSLLLPGFVKICILVSTAKVIIAGKLLKSFVGTHLVFLQQ